MGLNLPALSVMEIGKEGLTAFDPSEKSYLLGRR
jgi:hypothetical protein